MRGADTILNMRLNRKAPTIVYIETRPMNDLAKSYTERPRDDMDLHLDPSEVARIETLDLRFLVGIQVVLISGVNERDLDRIGAACVKAGAGRVESALYDDSVDPFGARFLLKTKLHTKDEVKTLWVL